MTPEDQRIAIATWMGWTQIEDKSEPLMMPKGSIVVGYPPKNQIIGKKQALPDYLNDLNEIHKAELQLTSPQRFGFYEELMSACNRDANNGNDVKNTIHATARQRSEALVKAIGEWK